MSLNIYIDYVPCKCCGRSGDHPGLNITHNLNVMAQAAGLYEYMWNADGKSTEEILPTLVDGYVKLLKDPDRYKKLNPPNGCGTYEGLVEFVSIYIKACGQPGKIRVSK